MIWGKPEHINADKVEFYQAYANQGDGLDVDEYFGTEKVVQEFETLKTVLINNAVPVDISQLE